MRNVFRLYTCLFAVVGGLDVACASPSTCEQGCSVLHSYCAEKDVDCFAGITSYCINDVNTFSDNVTVDCKTLVTALLSTLKADCIKHCKD